MTEAGDATGQRRSTRTLTPPAPSLLVALTALGCLGLAGCTTDGGVAGADPKLGVTASPRVVEGDGPIDPSISRRGAYMVGKPYVVAGKRFVPREDKHYEATGLASWYGSDFHGRLTANGEVFDSFAISAAHPTMPLPSYARVTNEENGRSLVVRVNDRGPFHAHRLIDVSSRAADLLEMKQAGIGHVKVEYIGRADEVEDNAMLAASLKTDGSPAALPVNTMVADAFAAMPAGEPAPKSIPASVVAQAAPVAVAQAAPATTATVPVLQPGRAVYASMQSSGGLFGQAAPKLSPDPSFDLSTIGGAATPVAGAAHTGEVPLPPQRRVALADGAAHTKLKVIDVVGGGSSQSNAALAFAGSTGHVQEAPKN